MSDSTDQRVMGPLDLKPLERIDQRRKIGVAVEMIASSIAPSNFDFHQRAKVEDGLNLLVDLILIEAQARAVVAITGDA